MSSRLATALMCLGFVAFGATATHGEPAQPSADPGGGAHAEAAGWKAGVAKAVVTPETPVWLAGYGSKRAPDGKLHDLWVKALALEDSAGRRAVLITSDFQGVPKEMSDRVFAELRRQFGLEREQVMLTFSHNHCGPRLGDDLVDYYPVDDAQVALVKEYTALMEQKLVALVGEALSQLAPARLRLGEGKTTFAVNRRNNREADVPSLLAQGKPLVGPVDHSVPVMTVTRPDGRLEAILFGYACHPTTLSFTQWCGDYPGFAQLELERNHPGATAMFVNTCGGDQNPLPRRSVELCEKYGRMLATAVEEALKQPLKPVSAGLRTAFESVDLAYLKVVDRDDLQAALQDGNAIRKRWASRLLRKLDAGETFPASYPYPVHAWRLGREMLVIGMGAETVVDYALRFKAEFGPGTWVCGYADDMIAYIPSRRVWEEGGYEGGSSLYEYGRPAFRWAGDVEDRIAATVHKLVEQVRDASANLDDELWAYWPLKGDTQDRSGNERHAQPHGGIDLQATGRRGVKGTAVGFNGRDAWLEVPAAQAPRLGRGDFSIAVWLDTDDVLDDVPGDILSQYDPARRRGFHLSLKANAVTTSLANDRHLHFGIDDNRTAPWIDCGRPGNALLAFALTVHEGSLYAGTCEPGANESGRVYRYAGGEQWIDCGAPDTSNSVTALAVYKGDLYAATGKYRVAGSALPESENTHLGGRVFRFAGPDRWIDCGRLPETEAVGGLIVFRGQLYASSLYRPAGFYRYDGEAGWVDCGTPDGRRVVALGVYNGHVYATSYDGGHVYRYDGTDWIDCGRLGENTQTYSFAVYQGRLYVGTWPSGRVYRFEEVGQWTDMGRLGEELEVMGMLVHNGRLIAGTLPLAEVYSYEGDAAWKRLTRLDHTPDVKYRRAWTMAEHDGRVFCSTLPSGKIWAFSAGQNVQWGRPLPSGWQHIAAVKSGDRLQLYVGGRQVAQSSAFDASEFDLDNTAPLRIGLGANDHLRGRLADLRIYRRALSGGEIRQLADEQ